MRAVRVRGRHFNSRQPGGLNLKIILLFRLWDESSYWGGGVMHGIIIPQQDFALKMQGGAYARGGAYLRDSTVVLFNISVN